LGRQRGLLEHPVQQHVHFAGVGVTVLVVLTLPVTVLTLGLFLLVINALILLLVAWVVPGFHVAGFWQAVLVALFISVFSFILNLLLAKAAQPRQ
jgi:putative membrane protein